MTGLLGTIAAFAFAFSILAILGPAITHQIAGFILLAVAVVAMGMAGIIYHMRQLTDRADSAMKTLEAIQRRIDAREAGSVERHADVKRVADAFDTMAKRRNAQ